MGCAGRVWRRSGKSWPLLPETVAQVHLRAFIDWSVGAQENLAPLLKQSRVSQLWIAGERDSKFTALARRAAGDKAVIIPHAGHRLPLEAPEKLAKCLQQLITATYE